MAQGNRVAQRLLRYGQLGSSDGGSRWGTRLQGAQTMNAVVTRDGGGRVRDSPHRKVESRPLVNVVSIDTRQFVEVGLFGDWSLGVV